VAGFQHDVADLYRKARIAYQGGIKIQLLRQAVPLADAYHRMALEGGKNAVGGLGNFWWWWCSESRQGNAQAHKQAAKRFHKPSTEIDSLMQLQLYHHKLAVLKRDRQLVSAQARRSASLSRSVASHPVAVFVHHLLPVFLGEGA